MGATVKLVGLDSLQRKLGADFKPAMRAASKAIALEIQGEIAPYPPATSANRPKGPGSKWYERGFGTKWMLKDGTVRGKKTSQTLGRRWGIKGKGAIGAVLGNIATYSPYVHSHEEQAKYHGKRGWVTDEKAVERVERRGTVRRIVEDAVMKAMGQ